MSEKSRFPIDSLVIYKKHPARLRQAGEKLEIELAGGELVKVRPKDIELLHPGPLRSLGDLINPAGDVETAWEILSGGEAPCTLAELAELAYGAFTPVTAWAAWRQLEDGLFFDGAIEKVRARSPAEVDAERQSRQARADQALAWADFVLRARQGQLDVQGDRRYLQEVEDLALGKRADCRLLRELGHAERPETAHAWLLEHEVWNAFIDPYPSRMGLTIKPVDLPLGELPDEERLDLTHLSAFAIDDQGNQDPDDAISLDGERLWVHIADVAALVPADSPADREARGRGANLYLPEVIAGMLPAAAVQKLGLGLEQRSPALSFGLQMDEKGEITQIEIWPSWVQVQRQTYDQVEGLLDQAPFQGLYELALRFRRRRFADHALEINLPETIMRVIDGEVVIRPAPALRSRVMVKEAMLMAGQAAARFAIERDIAFPYTNQDPADPATLAEIYGRLGRPRPDNPDDMALAFALRRAQKRSQVSSRPGAHAGLGLPVYTRATSPLRRYSDLIAHQQLRAALRGEAGLNEATLLERIGEAEAVSDAVGRAETLARRHWTLVYFEQHPGWQGEGVLVETRIGRGRLIIPELAFEAQVYLRRELPLNSRLALTFKSANLAELEASFHISS